MSESKLLSLRHPQAWVGALRRCGRFDSYHLPGYHLVAEQQGEGEPALFVFEDQGRWAALPFLRRPVAEVEGLESCDGFDAASAYGYPGVVTTACEHEPGADAFRRRFQDALRQVLHDLNVISLFIRQNPLIDTAWLLAPMAEVSTLGPTVAIDLSQPEEKQLRDFRSGHRYDVRSARKKGMVVYEDAAFDQIDLFRRIYAETMDRAGAVAYYYFTRQYFTSLKQHLGDQVKLFFSEQDGHVVGGAMFLVAGDVIQYHLSGTASDHLKCHGGTKLILDQVRKWGTAGGFRWLHLGGGRGARQDSLFEFKAGFSRVRFSFQTARMVLRPQTYCDLMERRRRWMSGRGYAVCAPEYFPGYRQAPVPARAA